MAFKVEVKGRRRPRVCVSMDGLDPEYFTNQESKDSCDLNRMVDRALRTGQPPDRYRGTLTYGDFSSMPSLAEALEIVSKAEESFMTYPAAARAELDNDFTRVQDAPREFFERYGLLKKDPDVSQSETPDLGGAGVKSPRSASKKPVKAPEEPLADQDDQE